MNIKNINNLEIPDMAKMAERKIEEVVNLLDGILWDGRDTQNRDAADSRDKIGILCEEITKAYEKSKGPLNHLQQG